MKAKGLLKTGLMLSVIFLGVFSVLILSQLTQVGSCSASTITVNPGESIQTAINNANYGDTILVKCGVYTESPIFVNKTVTIVGENAENTIMDGQGTAQNIFHINASNVIVEEFKINNTNPSPSSYSSAVQISNAVNVTVKNVIITNVVIGVEILSSNQSKVMYCTINRTKSWGVRLRLASCNNTIVGNTFAQNPTGILFLDVESRYSNVYNNTEHVSLFGVNYFDNGYPSGGNFWSGYSGVDLKSGPYQNASGSDGILDEGYPDPYFPWDKYPLANPLTNLDVSTDGQMFLVQASTNTTLTTYSLNYSRKSLNLLGSGSIDTVGACRTVIPKAFLSCESLSDWTISIYYSDGSWQSLPYLVLDDVENTYLFFSYNHTTSDVRIEIKGTKMVPEFSWQTMPIILALVSLIAAVAKKLRFRKETNLEKYG